MNVHIRNSSISLALCFSCPAGLSRISQHYKCTMADIPHSNGHNGNGHNGTGHNGTGHNGNDQENGTGQKSATAQNGTDINGTGINGTGIIGTAASRNGTGFRKCTCEFPRVYTGEDSRENLNGMIKKVVRTEFLKTADGAEYTRPHVCDPNPNQWSEVVQPVRPKTPPRYKSLWVVRQTQIGKNPHWSLFAAVDDDSDTPKGRVWQVNGDPDVGMHYAHRPPEDAVAMFLTRSFLDNLLVCSTLDEGQEAKLDTIANTIKPPGPSQTSPKQPRKIKFRGTCRTWVWDVLDRLVQEGITTAEVAAKARDLQPKPLE